MTPEERAFLIVGHLCRCGAATTWNGTHEYCIVGRVADTIRAAVIESSHRYEALLAAVGRVCEANGVNAEDVALAELSKLYESLTGRAGKGVLSPPLADPIAHAPLMNPD